MIRVVPEPTLPNIVAKILVVTILIAGPGHIFSQSTAVSCAESERVALQLIPQYYKSGDLATIDSILNKLDRCHGTILEYSWRVRTLLNFKNHKRESNIFNQQDFWQLEEFLNDRQLSALLDSVDENPRRLLATYYGPDIDLFPTFNEFTKDVAKQVLVDYQHEDECSTEKIVLNALSGNLAPVAKQLTDNGCTAPPAMIYRDNLKKASRRIVLDSYIYTGAWIPYGNNSLLGNHPIIGFGAGGGRKLMFATTMEFRFNKAANYYVVQNQGQNVTTNHFFGGYIGADFSYNFLSSTQSKFYIVSGTGIDGFDTIVDTSGKTHDGKSINAFNVNAGAGYRFFTPDGHYVGLETRNNFVKYKNPGGTSLDGNTITIRLMYGFMLSPGKKTELRRLHNMVRQ